MIASAILWCDYPYCALIWLRKSGAQGLGQLDRVKHAHSLMARHASGTVFLVTAPTEIAFAKQLTNMFKTMCDHFPSYAEKRIKL